MSLATSEGVLVIVYATYHFHVTLSLLHVSAPQVMHLREIKG